MRGTRAQSVEHTASRRSGPRRWSRSVEWLIAAGYQPKANGTTLAVAQDLAARMDYDTGHVRYCLDEMAARLGVSRATVKRHTAILRELGALVWAVHGTKANIRRVLGLGGYAATATVYAAVIPPVYDHAMGHTIIGSGYEARIVIDQRGQTQEAVDNPPVDNPGAEGREPPSLTLVKEEVQVQMVGGSKDTSQARPAKTRIPHQSSNINGRRRTAQDVKNAGKTVRMVRALVNWTQTVPLRRLEYVLRPLTDRGLDALHIAGLLQGMCAGLRWKPARPDVFIQSQLAADRRREQQRQEQEAQAARFEMENAPVGALVASPAQYADVMTGLRQGLTNYCERAKASGWDDLSHTQAATAARSAEDEAEEARAAIAAFLNSSPQTAAVPA
ncbi:helix-turn-helix domain-containing protein [Streptomyces sp. NPDC005900]|uniref:helix-turn-helix domain-containing protein n=1 Tax=Streptomyces sp. NPDC005900 TaxID=3154569 RepID=UPI0033E29F5B